MTRRFARLLAFAGLVSASPAAADVVASSDAGFVTREVAVVEADPKAVWLALISPAKWWNPSHTWSGDSANMRLTPQAGGCFCETIPEDPDAERVTLEGSVEHMRVIHAHPEVALRMRGSLGPLQSEAASGVLTIALSPVDEGTRIVWEYVVGGYTRYELPVIARAVDGVMSQQLAGLADLLGRVEGPSRSGVSDTEPSAEAPVDEEQDKPSDTPGAGDDLASIGDAIDAMASGEESDAD